MPLSKDIGDANIKLKTINLTRHFFGGCNTLISLRIYNLQSLQHNKIILWICENQAHKTTAYTCKYNGGSNVKIIIWTARPSFTSPHVGNVCAYTNILASPYLSRWHYTSYIICLTHIPTGVPTAKPQLRAIRLYLKFAAAFIYGGYSSPSLTLLTYWHFNCCKQNECAFWVCWTQFLPLAVTITTLPLILANKYNNRLVKLHDLLLYFDI